MSEDTSTFRLYLMGLLYLLNFVMLGLQVGLLNHRSSSIMMRQ